MSATAERRVSRRGLWGSATLALLVAWTVVGHPLFDREASGQGSSNTTFTNSTSTSQETVVTTASVRIDTVATRILATHQTGGVVFDQTFALPFADPTVQVAVAAARAALLAAPFPTLVILDGPTQTAASEEVIDSALTVAEVGRTTEMVVDVELAFGPDCISVGDRDAPNAMACGPSCTGAETVVPSSGTPRCVLGGTQNLNTNLDAHTVVTELHTTTDTYLTSATHALTGSLLDHFMLYKTKPTKGTAKLAAFGPVTLTDALGAADYDVTKLPGLGLPADKNAEGRADPDTHLAQYALKRRKGAPKFVKIPDVATANQCGTVTLTLAKPESLLVPVGFSLTTSPPARALLEHEVDHFLCYKAKAQKKRSNGTPVAPLAQGTQVDATDQFQTRRYDLKRVTRLCIPVTTAGTPVTKTGAAVPFVATPRRHPAGHLVCYQAKAASKTIPQNGCGPADPANKGVNLVPKQPKHQKRTGVQVNGPLGPAALDTANEVELCLPSTATLP